VEIDCRNMCNQNIKYQAAKAFARSENNKGEGL